MIARSETVKLFLLFLMCFVTANVGAAGNLDEGFWRSVKQGDVIEEYEIYLQQFPTGQYAGQARNRIHELRENEKLREENRQLKEAQTRPASDRPRNESAMQSSGSFNSVNTSGSRCSSSRDCFSWASCVSGVCIENGGNAPQERVSSTPVFSSDRNAGSIYKSNPSQCSSSSECFSWAKCIKGICVEDGRQPPTEQPIAERPAVSRYVGTYYGLELAKRSNCMACHTVDKRLVGPAFNDVRHRYSGRPGIERQLVEKIKNGGKGSWGEIPMPPNAAVSTKDIESLVRWILEAQR
jgi:cytochrome c